MSGCEGPIVFVDWKDILGWGLFVLAVVGIIVYAVVWEYVQRFKAWRKRRREAARAPAPEREPQDTPRTLRVLPESKADEQ